MCASSVGLCFLWRGPENEIPRLEWLFENRRGDISAYSSCVFLSMEKIKSLRFELSVWNEKNPINWMSTREIQLNTEFRAGKVYCIVLQDSNLGLLKGCLKIGRVKKRALFKRLFRLAR